jgi:FkbM family methyltransferase
MRLRATSRRLWRWAKGRDPLCFEDVRVPAVVLGSEYGGHCVCPNGLGPDAVVYSFGVGEDASFDVALIERFGVELHAFDPTPRSIAWVRAQSMPAGFHFHAIGLADYDGVGRFSPPDNPEHISHTLLSRPETAARALEVEVRTLPTLMRELGHARLSVLKLDIEGSEYAVLEQALAAGVAIDQVLVEYHHQFKSVPRARTADSVARLRDAGYRLFHVSETGREMSFIHQRIE